MKKIVFLIGLLMVLQSCQDVIELDLNDAPPRLVIDAFIELNEDGTTTTSVKLTRSAPFYQEEITTVTDAQVRIIREDGVVFNLANNNNEFYTTDQIAVQPDVFYTLEIINQGFTYRATEKLETTVPIVDVEELQIAGLGELTRITAFYNDPVGQGDYYLFNYRDANNFQVDVGDDTFFDGNRAPSIFFLEDLQPRTPIEITIKGINQNCFNFYEKLIQQSGGGGGGPFSTPPATVRGNVINTSNSANFPFGYFRISQVYRFNYTSL